MTRLPAWLAPPLPRDAGWLPYLWLLYLFPFLRRPLTHSGTVTEQVTSWVLLGVFLCSYFRAYQVQPKARALHVAVQAGVGTALLPWNPGAGVFFIYAGSAGGMMEPDRRAWMAVASVTVYGSAWAWFVQPEWYTPLAVAFMTPIIGASTLHEARERRARIALQAATERNAELAASAERERIARDLHDALGHTLSLVVLKAQVARRHAANALAAQPVVMSPVSEVGEADTSAHAAHLTRELAELEDAARGALADVRQAIRGYRITLDEAVATARALFNAAGIDFSVEVSLRGPDPARDSVLAAVLRELTTNVVRHADAHSCLISIHEGAGSTTLRVTDDGKGGALIEGHGLTGVVVRVQAVGGRIELDSPGRQASPTGTTGTTVMVVLPKPVAA